MATGLAEPGQDGVAVRVSGGGQWLQVDGADGGSTGRVYDAGGRLMAQFACGGSTAQPIGHWPEGIYVLRVQGPGGSPWHKKFVVMR